MNPSNPKQGEGAGLWLIKMVTGPLLIIFGLLHLVENHLVVEGGLMSYADVVTYFANPLIAITEAGFLILVVTHSLLGLRSVILDLNPNPIWLRRIDICLSILGAIAIIYGLWLTRLIHLRS